MTAQHAWFSKQQAALTGSWLALTAEGVTVEISKLAPPEPTPTGFDDFEPVGLIDRLLSRKQVGSRTVKSA